jgi:type IX secretion system PorP/SprF family membrane protein
MFKKRKHILTVFVFLYFSSIILGQNYFVSNLYNNIVFSNPAYVHFHEFSFLQLNYRNQWPVSNLYSSYGVSYFHYAEDLNSNFGAILNYDNQYKGTFTKASLGLNYAYKLRIGQKSHFLFGLQGFYNLENVNYSNLTFENQTAIIPENSKKHYPTFNSGIGLLLRKEHFIGLAVNNINSPSGSTNSDLRLNLTYIGKIKSQGYYSNTFFEPLINISSNFDYIHFQYGGNINYEGYKAGLLIDQTGGNVNTLIILLGISFENYEFVYTYDINLSGAISINPKMAAHEVTFLRKIQYKEKSKHRGAIKCPNI